MSTDELQVIEDRIARMVEAAQESDAAFAIALDAFRQQSLRDIRMLIAGVRASRAEIKRLRAENADLRVLIEQVRRDELMTGLAWDEEREREYEVRQALWAIASVDLTEEQIEEWASNLDERVRAEIARLREQDD